MELVKWVVPVADLDQHCVAFFYREGVLYRKWLSSRDGSTTKQIVLPGDLKFEVLSLAHDTSTGGHMHVKKTHLRILRNLYWPNVFKEVAHLSLLVRFARRLTSDSLWLVINLSQCLSSLFPSNGLVWM